MLSEERPISGLLLLKLKTGHRNTIEFEEKFENFI